MYFIYLGIFKTSIKYFYDFKTIFTISTLSIFKLKYRLIYLRYFLYSRKIQLPRYLCLPIFWILVMLPHQRRDVGFKCRDAGFKCCDVPLHSSKTLWCCHSHHDIHCILQAPPFVCNDVVSYVVMIGLSFSKLRQHNIATRNHKVMMFSQLLTPIWILFPFQVGFFPCYI